MRKPPSTLERYIELKKTTDRLQRETDRAVGAHQQLMKRLKVEFGSRTYKEGTKLLSQRLAEKKKATQAFEAALEELEQEHKEVLNHGKVQSEDGVE